MGPDLSAQKIHTLSKCYFCVQYGYYIIYTASEVFLETCFYESNIHMHGQCVVAYRIHYNSLQEPVYSYEWLQLHANI